MQISQIVQADGLLEGVAKKYQSKAGGLNDRGRAHYNRQGHKLKKPVTKRQAKKSPKSASRRKSFCSRMGGQKRMHGIDCRQDPEKDICRALNRWDCNESFNIVLAAVLENSFDQSADREQGHSDEDRALDIMYQAFDHAGIKITHELFWDLYGRWVDMTVGVSESGYGNGPIAKQVRISGIVEPSDWLPLNKRNTWVTPKGFRIGKQSFRPENIEAIHEVREGEWTYEDIESTRNE